MKHGDKAKSKAASKQASVKKSSKASAHGKAGAKSGKAGTVVKSQKQQAPAKTAKQAGGSKAGASGSNGKPVRGAADAGGGFANPVVAAAFKRAVKKYPNAFRRLTD